MFSEEQMNYIMALGLQLDFDNLSDDDYFAIENIVADRLQMAGFDLEYCVTEEGVKCEEILDTLSDI